MITEKDLRSHSATYPDYDMTVWAVSLSGKSLSDSLGTRLDKSEDSNMILLQTGETRILNASNWRVGCYLTKEEAVPYYLIALEDVMDNLKGRITELKYELAEVQKMEAETVAKFSR